MLTIVEKFVLTILKTIKKIQNLHQLVFINFIGW